MFTGIVQALGRVERVGDEREGRRLAITWPALDEPVVIGESIAVNGCCLTVVAADGMRFEVQVGPESLARTNLSRSSAGSLVNLERSLRASERLGGHFVQGHVDTTAVLQGRRREGDWVFMSFEVDNRWTRLMVPKGSVAVDGVSLTLVDVEASSFSVMLIPHTLAVTTLGLLEVGDRVNIETDILAKHVEKLLLK